VQPKATTACRSHEPVVSISLPNGARDTKAAWARSFQGPDEASRLKERGRPPADRKRGGDGAVALGPAECWLDHERHEAPGLSKNRWM
jgi:hypothetical protein